MSSFRVLRRCAAPAALAAVLAGCGASSSSSTTTHRPSTPAAMMKSSNGVPLPAHPERIVSLSASSTEDLYAVGAGSQVVAVDQNSTYPPSAPRTKLSGDQPNVEAIAKYNPDLVVTFGNINHVSPQLGALHIPVLIESPPATLDGAYAQLSGLGRATGHVQQANRVVVSMRRQVTAILASVPKPSGRLSVYHELDETHYAASSRTFIGQIYSLFGLSNIADKAAKASVYPQLSSESIISSDPSLIVLADTVCCGQSLKTVAKRPGWGGIAAVRHGAVLAVNDSIASEWGPRVVMFMRVVAAEVHTLEAAK